MVGLPFLPLFHENGGEGRGEEALPLPPLMLSRGKVRACAGLDSGLNPLFVGVQHVYKTANVGAIPESGLLFAHLQPFHRSGIRR